MPRVYLKGLPELKRKLIALKKETEKDMIPIMERAATEITEMMKRMSPVDDGDLRDSIGWTFGQAPKRAIKFGKFKGGSLTITIYAGNETAFYAHWTEFGTRAHTITENQGGLVVSHPGSAAHPFFFPSWRASKRPVKKMIAKGIQDAVRRVSRT